MSWPSDNSANRYVKTYLKDWLDISGTYLKMTHGDILIEDGSMSIKTVNIDSDSTSTILVPDLSVNNTLTVNESTILHSTLDVDGATKLKTTLDVSGATVLDSTLDVTKATTLSSTLNVDGDVSMAQHLNVDGDVSFGSNLDVYSNVSANKLVVNDLTLDQHIISTNNGFNLELQPGGITDTDTGEIVWVRGGLKVDGSINFTGSMIRTDTEVKVTSQIDISNDGTGPALIAAQHGTADIAEFYDDLNLAMIIKNGGHVAMGYNLDVSGATVLDSTLDVTGATKLKTTLDVSGATVLDSTLDVTGATKLKTTLDVSGATVLDNTLDVTGATVLDSTLNVTDATKLKTTLDVSGATVLDNTLNVTGATKLKTTLDVSGATVLDNTLNVTGATKLKTTLDVSGATVLDSTLNVTGATKLKTTLDVSGATVLDSTLNVTGATKLKTTLDVSGATVLDNTLDVTGATKLKTTLDVSGATVLDNTLNVTGATKLKTTLDVSGATVLDSTLDVTGATKLKTTLDVSGATVLDNTLNVTGATTIDSTLDVYGDVSFGSSLVINGDTSLNGFLHLGKAPSNSAQEGAEIQFENNSGDTEWFMDVFQKIMRLRNKHSTASSPKGIFLLGGTNDAGKIGINTQNPAYDLHVNGNAYATDISAETSFKVGNTSITNGNITIKDDVLGGDVNAVSLYNTAETNNDSSVSIKFYDHPTTETGTISNYRYDQGDYGLIFKSFYTNPSDDGVLSEHMVLRNGGVGIGTDHPDYKLHVNGIAYASDISAGSLIVDNLTLDSNTITTPSDTNLLLRPGGDTDGDERVVVRGDLWVDGSINFSGNMIRTDTNVQVTDQLDISNTGTGPALIARQYGDQPVAQFYDDANLAMEIMDGGDVSMVNGLTVGNMQVRQDGTNYYLGHSASTDSNYKTKYAIKQDATNKATYINTGGDNLRFAKDGSVKMVMTTNGLALNEGNGPTSGYKLDVVDNVLFQNDLHVNGDVSFNSDLAVAGATTLNTLSVGTGSSNVFDVSSSGKIYAVCNINNTTPLAEIGTTNSIKTASDDLKKKLPLLRLTANRGSGTGTGDDTNYGAFLEISHSLRGVRLETVSESLFSNDVGFELRTYNGNYNTVAMRITSDDLVGIGKTNPAYKLDVNGTAYATDISAGNSIKIGATRITDDILTTDISANSLAIGSDYTKFTVASSGVTYIANTLDVSGALTVKNHNNVFSATTNYDSPSHTLLMLRQTNDTHATRKFGEPILSMNWIDNSTSNNAYCWNFGQGGNSNATTGGGSTSTLGLGYSGDGGGSWNWGSGPKFYFTASGEFGIGINDPAYKLHVVGDAYATNISADTIKVDNLTLDGTSITTTATDGFIVTDDISVNGTIRAEGINLGDKIEAGHIEVLGNIAIGSNFYNDSPPSSGAIIEGNVGIGTTNPSYKLDVNGVVYATDISAGSSIKVGLTTISSTGTDLSGTPTAPTAPANSNNTQIANTEYVDNAVSNIQLTQLGVGSSNDYNNFTVDTDGNTATNGTLEVDGDVSFNSNLAVAGEISANTLAIGSGYTGFTVDTNGATSIANTLEVDGDVSMAQQLNVDGDVSFNSDLAVAGEISANTLAIGSGYTGFTVDSAGATYIANTLEVDGDVSMGLQLNVDGDVSFNSDLAVAGEISARALGIGTNYNQFNVDSAGATYIASTLEVDGDVSFNSDLAVVGTAYATDISTGSLKVDNLTFDGNTITTPSGTDLLLQPGGDNSNDTSDRVWIKGGLWVDGSINFSGNMIRTDTNVQVTDQLDISNTGTGPALIARQYGAEPIAQFYDDANLAMEIMDGGDVSMGYGLTVGNMQVRQSGTNYYLGHSNNTDTNYTSRYAIIQGSGGETQLNTATNNSLFFSVGDSRVMTLRNYGLALNGGNIPTSGYKLDVAGDVLFRNDLDVSSIDVSNNINLNANSSAITLWGNNELYSISMRSSTVNGGSFPYGIQGFATKFSMTGNMGWVFTTAGSGVVSNNNTAMSIRGDGLTHIKGPLGIGVDPSASDWNDYSLSVSQGMRVAYPGSGTGNGTGFIKIAGNNSSSGKAALFFGLQGNDNTKGHKGLILYTSDGTGGYGRANMYFCLNNSTDGNAGTEDASIDDAKMTIKRGGNVGIGTTTPAYTLDVNGTAYATDISAGNSIKIGATSITDDILTTNISASSLAIGSGYNKFTVDSAGATSIANTLEVEGDVSMGQHLNVDGDVSFGSNLDVTGATTIDSRLDVNGNTTLNGYLHLGKAPPNSDNEGAEIQFENNSGDTEWYMDVFQTRMRLRNKTENQGIFLLGGNDAGKIGINTQNPSYNLHVNGTAYATDISAGTSIKIGATSITDDILTTDISANSLAIGSDYTKFTVDTSGNVVIKGTLTVSGTGSSTDSGTLDVDGLNVDDNVITITQSTGSEDMGLYMTRISGDKAFMGWDESIYRFVLGTTTSGSSSDTFTIDTGTLVANLEGKAALTIDSTGATPATGTNNTSLATTAFVYAAMDASNIIYTAGTGIQISTNEIRLENDLTSNVSNLEASYNYIINNYATTSTVNGLTTTNISEGSNLYFTDSRTVSAIQNTWQSLDTTASVTFANATISTDLTVHDAYMGDAGFTNSSEAVFCHNNFENSNTDCAFRQNSAGDTIVNTKTGQKIWFRHNNNNDIMTLSGSNVGIGTTTPSVALEVVGDVSFGSNLAVAGTLDVSNTLSLGPINDTYGGEIVFNPDSDNNQTYYANVIDNVFGIRTTRDTSGNGIYLKSDGNVGIGRTDPSSKLHVNGGARIEGGLTVTTSLNVQGSISNNNGDLKIIDDLEVTGDVSMNSNLDVAGEISASTLAIGTTKTEFSVASSGDTTISGNMAIGKAISNDYALDISGDFRVTSKDGYNAIKVERNSYSGNDNPYVIIGNTLSGTDISYTWGTTENDSTVGGQIVANNEFDRIPLHVGIGYENNTVSFWRRSRFDYQAGNSTADTDTRDISIITKESILVGGTGLFIYSDKRIKNNIQTINDNQALLDFRQLNPCTYSYVDKIQRGNKTVYGFIAQEVEEVLPYACTTQVETVPNVYGIADVSGEYLILQNDATFNDLDTDLKDSSGNNYNIITLQVYNDNDKFNVYVDNIINETTLTLKIPLRTEDCVYDSSSNKYQIFVYGQRVNNFKALDKNAIWTVAAAATQEIDRQQQADKVRIAELETNMSSLQSEVSSLQSEVSSLQSEVSSLQSQLSNVLSRLSALENP